MERPAFASAAVGESEKVGMANGSSSMRSAARVSRDRTMRKVFQITESSFTMIFIFFPRKNFS
jgi:hypothetical protein